MSILTAPALFVNFDLDATPAVEAPADDFRPTFDTSYYPSIEEERDAREMFADEDGEPSDADYDAMAEDALALDMVCSGHWAF